MEGWSSTLLGEVCEIIKRGISPKYLDEGGMCVLNQKCIRDHAINYTLARRHDVTHKKVTEERLLQIGDVLVNSTGVGTLGRVAQLRTDTEEPTTVDSHVTIVRPRTGLFHLDFFGYMLIRIEDEIAASGQGAGGQTELARKMLAEVFKVSFPRSLTEQEQIVAILDETFAAISTAIVNAEKNLANAQELFESELNRVFSQKEDGWVKKTLEELCVIGDGNHSSKYPKKSEMVKSGVPFIRGTNLVNGRISTQDMRYITQAKHELLKKGHLQAEDVLFTNRGEIGKVAIVDKQLDGANLNSQLAWFRCRPGLLPEYLLFFLQSGSMRRHYSKTKSGAALQQFTIRMIKAVTISFPSEDEQMSIVRSLSVMRDLVSAVESGYLRKLSALTELKQSILHKAFTGELTADPKAADRTLSEAGL